MQAEVNHVAQPSNASLDEEQGLVLEADIGTLTHRYLELIASQGLAAWPITRLLPLKLAMQRWFTGQGYAMAAANQGADGVLSLLETTLESARGQWVLRYRESARNELQVESLADSGLQVRKKIIDRTFIEDGVRWIVDYKTMAFESNADEAIWKVAAEQYRQQLEGYASLFIAEDLPIKLAVYFVSVGQLVTL